MMGVAKRRSLKFGLPVAARRRRGNQRMAEKGRELSLELRLYQPLSLPRWDEQGGDSAAAPHWLSSGP